MPKQHHLEHRPSPTQKKPVSRQHTTNTMNAMSPAVETPEVVQLQRVMGNRAVQRQMQTNSIQRLMTPDDLTAKAGVPQKDKLFGLKKMSEKYKAVLEALRQYHDRLNVSVDIAGPRFAEGLDEMLDTVAKTGNAYITAHPGDTRTPHISKLVNEDVPQERSVLQVVMTNDALREKFAGKSLREALALARDQQALTKAVESLAKPTPSQTKQDEAKQTYSSYLSTDNQGLTGTISDETKSSGTQPFRGSDDLTVKGKALTQALGQDYIKTTLMPFMGKLLAQAIGPDVLTSASALNTPERATQDELAKVPATNELVNKLYGELVTGLLVKTGGGTALPDDILAAAAETYARVFDSVDQDPKAQHAAEHSARVSVVNLIFLRFINPTVMEIASKLPAQSTVQFIALRLGQIFQGQANGIDIVAKFPEMSDSAALINGTGLIINGIIDGVIENGRAKALLLKAQRPPPTRQRSGGFVIGQRGK